MIFYPFTISEGSTKNRAKNLTRTLLAWNPRAAFENSSQAESSCRRAEGAKLMEGHLVTMEPSTIYETPLIQIYIYRYMPKSTYRAGEHMSPQKPHPLARLLELGVQISHHGNK